MERIKRALELARTQRESPAAQPGAISSAEVTVPAEPERHAWRTPVVPVDRAHLQRERILDANESGAAAAPYKMLRTQVLRRLEQLGATTLAIVSPRAHDGKTLTAINLAISLAADPNRTTLLVDFDLRRPQVAARFGLTPAVGVEQCLEEKVPVEQGLVRPEGYGRLTLLPAGAPVAHSSELLGSARTGELVREIRSRYANRIVLFDLPPVLEADDALAFSRHVEAALVVITEGRTRREDVTRTLQLLGQTPVVGTLLNGSREVPGSYY
jgi:Mrp family chromosome partitioning ATPase